jgi:hypothetical protein
MNRDAANEHSRPNQSGAAIIRNAYAGVSAIHMHNNMFH